MFDVAVEQIVKVKPPKISILYKVVLIIACVVAATTIPQTMTFGIIVLALLLSQHFWYSSTIMQSWSIHLLRIHSRLTGLCPSHHEKMRCVYTCKGKACSKGRLTGCYENDSYGC